MKKSGFTLAEVLITLGVVGVVAALTLPAVVVNYRKTQIGTSLAKAINTLETANQAIFEDKSISELSDLDGDYIPDILQKNVILKADGGNNSGYYSTKDGIAYKQNGSWRSVDFMGNTNAYSGKYTEVVIDIDGALSGQNKPGVDRFLVWVDDKGSVVPYGSAMYAQYISGGWATSYIRYNNTWKEFCNDNEVIEAWYCTGNIVDHGYKVEYDL